MVGAGSVLYHLSFIKHHLYTTQALRHKWYRLPTMLPAAVMRIFSLTEKVNDFMCAKPPRHPNSQSHNNSTVLLSKIVINFPRYC
jgi:hypothetical protein